jgi:protein-tyrosine-phosphatase
MGPEGRLSPEEARNVAKARNLDLVEHRSQVLNPELIAWADLIVVMERNQGEIAMERHGADRARILLLGDLDPIRPTSRDIPDPENRPQAYFEEVFDRIDRCLVELGLLLEPVP